jgi:amino acid adenylation domain-containing protein
MLFLLHHAIDQSAARSPDQDAIRCGGTRLTYAELVERSNQLAGVLVAQGVRRGDRVGIYMRKCVEAGVAINGIMKAGAAYVPLDPLAPPARLAFVVDNCGIRHIVTRTPRPDTMRQIIHESSGGLCIVGIDGQEDLGAECVSWNAVAQHPGEVGPDVGTIEQDLAYILYTSGSTGTPKGIMHTHRSALSWAEVAADTYAFTPEDRLSNHAPLHFDLSTLDYFSTAVVGATLVVIPEEYTMLPASLAKLIADEKLTVYYTVPLALMQLLQSGAVEANDLSALRWVLFGGEPMPTKHLRALMGQLPNARFSNVYGPTEVNGCTHYPVPPLDPDCNEPIPIGRPYSNVESLVVDAHDREVNEGETGELLIRSPTMMSGYWGRPDLDELAYYYRPAAGNRRDVFHRTGDLVQTLPDGNFKFLGRMDRQVKMRGHRVELDEVEAVLLTHEQIKEAAVYTVPDGEGSKTIEAAVITASPQSAVQSELMGHATKRLPRYAIPSKLVIVDTLPRTSTGKIDRRQLQAWANEGRADESLET